MGEDKKEGKVDSWFGKIQNYVTGKIGAFVAFLFLLFAAGAAVALMVIDKWPEAAWLVVIIPALAGILAYYNRTFATIAFVVLMIGILFI